jgi:uncharacterized delta-60 repeat protein
MARVEANPTGRGRALLLLALFGLGLVCLAVPAAAESGVTLEWVRRFGGPAKASDYPTALKVDGQGNVYVAGGFDNGNHNMDYLTIKYNPTGKRLWMRRYKPPGGTNSWLAAMALDAEGNIYVTGRMAPKSRRSVWDCTTIKYNPDGRRIWVRSYNGLGNGEDYANAIAVDGQGNIIVAGSSWSGTAMDYLTIKYSPDGKRLWVRRYNNPDTPQNEARSITIDSQGNVFVFGLSWDPNNSNDFLTIIKYNPEGRQLWVASSQEPGKNIHDRPRYYTKAKALAVDPQGNVFVSGGSNGYFLTIKYNPEGQVLWSHTDKMEGYGGPEALAVDSHGNVLVAGGRNTIKYNTDGQLLWLKDPGFSILAMALDTPGNVYVTGGGFFTLGYSPEGEELWVHQFLGPGYGYYSYYGQAIAVDVQGHVYVTGYNWYNSSGPDSDFFTLKYLQSPREGP